MQRFDNDTYSNLQKIGNLRLANAELLEVQLPEIVCVGNDVNSMFYRLELPFKLQMIVDPILFCKHILQISQSCIGIILQPNKFMHYNSWDTIMKIYNWPQHIRTIVKQKHPQYFGNNEQFNFMGCMGIAKIPHLS